MNVKEQYPNLENELNSFDANIPAYVRFQRQDQENCSLRDDLKTVKERHFRVNYQKELAKPKLMMKKVEAEGHYSDGTTYFETKFYLTEKQRQDKTLEKDKALKKSE